MHEEPIQRSLAELANMPPEEVVRARRAGELDELLAGRDPGVPAPVPVPTGSADQGARGDSGAGQITDSGQLRRMSPEEIVAARRKGRLDEYLGIRRSR